MSKKKPTAAATITYIVNDETTFDIDTNMSEGQIADQQAAFWNEIANLPAGRRGQTVLPRERERLETERQRSTRHVEKAYLRYK
jgi:hypothetical protein